jgi:hypothetical protein
MLFLGFVWARSSPRTPPYSGWGHFALGASAEHHTATSSNQRVLMGSVVYNIPVAMIESYRGRPVVVRSQDPADFPKCLMNDDLENLAYIQLLSPKTGLDALFQWGPSIPVDLVMLNPERGFPRLYEYSQLLPRHPVRVSIPVIPGFGKSVKLAVSLSFAIKLEVGQPDPALEKELSQVLNLYLHQPTVSQPIEPFHSILFAFYHDEPATLWAVQEEDPSCCRYITDQGEETIAKRFAGEDLGEDVGSFVEVFESELLIEKGECSYCEFLEYCCGYFKWPQKEFSCEGVKAIFRTLKDAAEELQKDHAAYLETRREGQPR